ncbi:amino acid ABC transporter permease [Nocardioides zeae]|uniref:Amino acid ABC transporter permease n=1 Tax=Nocardioides imazamoxiresistens TaxID=3231893 RepID=A0ABU3PXW6_9ACTN|nr:amino acid ABC transporter permease [Nocardioides zeae]MDT9593652.1 amino acid ABC transporter permease [Nocardioides zeae]
MSASVLFDAPGPKARMRHRILTGVAALLLLGVAALVVMRMADRGQLEYALWEPFVTTSYVQFILEGLVSTLQMAALSILFAVVFGAVFGIGKLSEITVVRWVSWLVVEFFRAVPVLLLMVFLFVAYALGDGPLSSFWCVVIALTLYNGSVLAEVLRAGINAVPTGQTEAAYAIGLRRSQVVWLIQLPQAVRTMLPALISQCVVALKDTSLGYYILAPGLTAVARPIYQEFGNHVPTAIVITALYIIVNLILTGFATWLEKRLSRARKATVVDDLSDSTNTAGPAV